MKRSLLILAGLALFAGCKVGSKQLEDNITAKLKEMGVEMKSVSCPSGGGDKYTCTGETKDGDKVNFDVTNDSNGANWKLRGKVLDLKDVGDNLESEIGNGADVKCPKKTIILQKGKEFTCDVEVKGEKGTVQITAVDDDGNVKQKVLKAGGGDDDDDKGKKKGDDDDDKGKKKKGDDDDDK